MNDDDDDDDKSNNIHYIIKVNKSVDRQRCISGDPVRITLGLCNA